MKDLGSPFTIRRHSKSYRIKDCDSPSFSDRGQSKLKLTQFITTSIENLLSKKFLGKINKVHVVKTTKTVVTTRESEFCCV